MTRYWTLPGFEELYLEDSWILSIEAVHGSLTFTADLVLRESHPRYHSPTPGEQYCYRRGRIEFRSVQSLSWSGQGAAPATDAAGEHDLGSFDEFVVDGDRYVIVGDFGRIELVASRPEVELT